MGVPGLQSYFEAEGPDPEDGFPPFFYPIDIASLKDREGRNNVIVVDLMSSIRKVYSDVAGLELLCGGQHSEYLASWSDIIQKFNAVGFELIFVCDGPVPEEKRPTWVKRRYENLSRYGIPVFDALKRGKYPIKLIESSRSGGLPSLQTKDILREFLKVDVVVTSADEEADAAVVKMPMEKNAVAILAQDSDYAVYDYNPNCLYLSMQLLNVDTLTTYAFDRVRMCDYLGIRLGQLPLLALLKGNDIVPISALETFHRRIVTSERQRRLQKRRRKPFSHLIIESLGEVIADFPDSFQAIVTALPRLESGVDVEIAKKVLRGYFSILTPDDRSMKASSVLSKNSRLFYILNGGCYETSFCLEDYRESHRLPPSAFLWRNCRRRIYGLLFEGKETNVPEWCLTGPTSLEEAAMVSTAKLPEAILAILPDLENLSEDSDSWRIFAYVISPDLDWTNLKALNAQDVLITCFLRTLKDEEVDLLGWEIEAFLMNHFVFKTKCESTLELVKFPPNVPDPRGIHLASLYTRSALPMLLSLIKPPGLELIDLLNVSNFDGKLFQSLYLDFKYGRRQICQLGKAEEERAKRILATVCTKLV